MKIIKRILLSCLTLYSLCTWAGPQEELLNRYGAEVSKAIPGFTGFSISQGEAFHKTRFGTGKPDTPACSSCHQEDPHKQGQTRTGKAIEPMALSASPQRYTDPVKVEKWFQRNCNEVLGRACTAQEKGNWLAYMLSR